MTFSIIYDHILFLNMKHITHNTKSIRHMYLNSTHKMLQTLHYFKMPLTQRTHSIRYLSTHHIRYCLLLIRFKIVLWFKVYQYFNVTIVLWFTMILPSVNDKDADSEGWSITWKLSKICVCVVYVYWISHVWLLLPEQRTELLY